MGADTPKTSISLAQQENDKARARHAEEKADKLAALAANANRDPLLPDDSPDASPVEAQARQVG